jgi:hypothetical protein
MPQDTMKVVIDEALKRRFKVACTEQDQTMSDVVCALVQGWLDGQFVLQNTGQQDKPIGQDTPNP